ncbi:MAG: hypothetical protein MN733_01950 [Nitrososphaera sp.]|nr:hypothetical protein [Nitrososphaera sp.]
MPYHSDFAQLKGCIGDVLELRRRAWEAICHILHRSRQVVDNAQIQRVHRLCILASSSRGGTSVTAELLQWQGADCTDRSRRLLTLPGEEKPHLILAGLAFPSRAGHFDDLTAEDAQEAAVSRLSAEMLSEAGHPISSCENLHLYAAQLYRRLLLQWPMHIVELKMENGILRLAKALQIRFPHGYADSTPNRRQVLAACISCFPFIRPSFYDCWPARSNEDALLLSGRGWSIEETPFVLPPPWCNATPNDLEEGCLLLRDPSNAWRLPFWRTVFPIQDIAILHLIRDPHESVQGLCDGWNYPFGFQSMPSQEALVIHGYNDSTDREGSGWKYHRLNFSINKTLSRVLLDEHRAMSLVHICAHQWRDAHARIIRDVEHLSLPRSVVNFADLRKQPDKTFQELCEIACLEQSSSGLVYAHSFPERRVMATSMVGSVSHERWQVSPFATEIATLGLSGFFDEVSQKLGLVQLAFGPAKSRSGNKLGGSKRPIPGPIRDFGGSFVAAKPAHA